MKKVKNTKKYLFRNIHNKFSSVTTKLFNNHVCNLAINNSKSQNSLTLGLLENLHNEVTTINSRDFPANIVLVTTEGNKVFSSGYDLKALNSMDNTQKKDFIMLSNSLLMNMKNSNKLFIVETYGLVLAAGCQLALACDMIIADKSSQFCIPGNKLGLYPSNVAIDILRNLKTKVAFEVLLNGLKIDANQAYEQGFVNKVV